MATKRKPPRINVRTKGAEGEREIIKLLQPVLEKVYAQLKADWPLLDVGECPVLQRNTLQSDRGGFDIVGTEWLALEIKRQETLLLPAWWAQTVKQAKRGQTPVLIYRRNGAPWRVRMPVVLKLALWQKELEVVGDVCMDDFLVYFARRAYDELGKKSFVDKR